MSTAAVYHLAPAGPDGALAYRSSLRRAQWAISAGSVGRGRNRFSCEHRGGESSKAMTYHSSVSSWLATSQAASKAQREAAEM
jgi:hypothetical protein